MNQNEHTTVYHEGSSFRKNIYLVGPSGDFDYNSMTPIDEDPNETNDEIKDLNRGIVMDDYNSAKKKNKKLFSKGDQHASSEYIYPNQIEDAFNICHTFYSSQVRVISIIKRTKVGMDGLMIEIAKTMATHSDNRFVLDPDNVLFLTGMSNKSWENSMKDIIPNCFEKNVYHHGKLKLLEEKLRKKDIKDSLFIIDEIDTGDKEDQKLHRLLKNSGILDIDFMKEKNIRLIFVSATNVKELQDLYKWGEIHQLYSMTIPSTYIGHKEFLERGIIQEFYKINSKESAERWIKEDILEHYNKDYRVHIIRTDTKNVDFISDACIQHKINFKNHTSSDRISQEDFSNIFEHMDNHLVIAVKGLLRRANLIPNAWKLKIGATHEKYVKKPDTNVQVQGLPGRMTGYWKDAIVKGHKTGPHRTSINAIEQYEEFYKNPLAHNIKYTTNGSKKLLTNPKNIKHLDVSDEPESPDAITHYRVYKRENDVKAICKLLDYNYKPTPFKNGFKETSLNKKKEVASLKDAISKVPTAYGTRNGKITWRTCYPCYVDPTDKETLRFVLIIRPETDIEYVRKEIDTKYNQSIE